MDFEPTITTMKFNLNFFLAWARTIRLHESLAVVYWQCSPRCFARCAVQDQASVNKKREPRITKQVMSANLSQPASKQEFTGLNISGNNTRQVIEVF